MGYFPELIRPPLIIPDLLATNTTTSGFGANVAYMTARRTPFPILINRISVLISASSGNICVGIYDDDGSSGEPSTLLTTSGSVASPGSGLQAITVPTIKLSGFYWIAAVADNGTSAWNIDQGNKRDMTDGSLLSNPFRNKSSAFPLPDPVASAAATTLGPTAWAHRV